MSTEMGTVEPWAYMKGYTMLGIQVRKTRNTYKWTNKYKNRKTLEDIPHCTKLDN